MKGNLDMNAFNRLKKLCDEKGISVNILEERLEIGRNSLYSWKKNIPKGTNLIKVADYFNVSTDYLLGRTAFRKPMELFEHWGGHNDPYFESPFDFGGLLREAREAQDIQQQEVSKALDISDSDVDDIENGILPLNYEWAEKYAIFLDTSVKQLFIDNDMDVSLNDIPLDLLRHYQEKGMTETEMAFAYLKIKKAEEENAMQEIHTVAAHHDNEEWSDEELDEIERFKEFVKSRRKQ